MKLREFVISSAMMSFTFGSVDAVTPPLPSPLIAEDKILASAYYDTLSILNTPNKCSEFFGGAALSVEIFNGLIANVRKGYFPPSVGIQMSGVVDMFNMTTKNRYRLFDKVSINANGPFYRKKFSNSEPAVPAIGKFEPNTKEARVLMLLHELGHVVPGKDGAWLLPDDGKDDFRSRENTRKIESVCGSEIRSLRKGDTAMTLASGKQE